MEDDPFAELKAEIEADRLRRLEYKKQRTKQATEAHHRWLANLSPEQLQKRKADKLAYEQRTRKQWTAHKHAMRRKRKVEIIAYLGGVCVDCGGAFHPKAMDVHHTDPSKKTMGIADMYQGKWERVIKELEHCILLCANCHRIRHDED